MAANMTEPNAIALAQNKLAENIDGLTSAGGKARKQARNRKWLARLLKAVAIFGGIAIAAGIETPYSQAIGIGISVAVGIDQLFANHQNLLIYARAEGAYEMLRKRVQRTHDLRVIPIVSKVQKKDDDASEQLLSLLTSLIKLIHDELEKIEEAVFKKSIQTLVALEIEHQQKSPN